MDQNTQSPTYYIIRLRQVNVVDKDLAPVMVHRNELRTSYLPSSLDSFFSTRDEAIKFAETKIPSILMSLGDAWIKVDTFVEILAIQVAHKGEATRLIKWE